MKPSDEEVYASYVKMCRAWRTKPAPFEEWQKINAGITPFVSEKFQLQDSRRPGNHKRIWD